MPPPNEGVGYQNGQDQVPEAVYQQLAAQVAALHPCVAAHTDWFRSVMFWRFLMYFHQSSGSVTNGIITDWGDCGDPHAAAAAIPLGGLTALSDINVALGISTSAATVVGATGAVAAGSTAAGAIAAVPIIGAIAAPVLLLLSAIFAHHAHAVQVEQSTLCGCTQGIDEYLIAIDNAYYAGSVGFDQASAFLDQLEGQFITCVAPASNDKCNSAALYKAYMTCVVLIRKWIYQNLPYVPPAPVAIVQSATQTVAAVATDAGNELAAVLGLGGGGLQNGSGPGSGIGLIPLLLAIAALALFL